MKHALYSLVLLLVSVAGVKAQLRLYEGGSAIKYGFARLENKSSDASALNGESAQSTSSYYVDTTGQVVFNTILSGSFYGKNELTDYQLTYGRDTTSLPQKFVLVQKGTKIGVLTVDGHWILKPVYDSIDTQYDFQWTLKKDGKMSLFTVHGFELPFRFDMAYAMDSNYYNVVSKGKWGVYSKKADSLVVPCIYEDMDYCYGCESKGDYCFAQKDGKWGVINFQGQVLLPFEYDHQHINMRSDEWVYCLYKNGRQLIINLDTHKIDIWHGEVSKEEDTAVLADGFKRVLKADKYGLLNPAGKLILDYKYDYIRYDADSTGLNLPAPFIDLNENNLWGVADTTGKIIIQPQYNSGLHMLADSFFVCENDHGTVLLNKTGQKAFPGMYDDIALEYTEERPGSTPVPYFKLTAKDHYGIYNPANQTFVPSKFDGLDKYMFNISAPHCVKITRNENGDKLEGLLDVQTGQVVMPPLYPSIANIGLPAGVMIVNKKEKYGLYNYMDKKLITAVSYDYIDNPAGYTAFIFRTGSLWGLMDFSGKVICPPDYFQIEALSDSFYLLTQQTDSLEQPLQPVARLPLNTTTQDNLDFQDVPKEYHDNYLFFNARSGKVLASPYDSLIEVQADTLAIIRDSGKYKLWNPISGKIIQGAYSKGGYPDLIYYFKKGHAIMEKNHKSAMIDARGDYIIPLAYDGLSDFYKGVAIMLQGEDEAGKPLYGFVDSTGKVLVPANYVYDDSKDNLSYFPDSCLLLLARSKDGSTELEGLAHLNGSLIAAPIYDHVYAQSEGNYYFVQKDKKFGVLDRHGAIVLPLVFDDIALNQTTLDDRTYDLNFPLLARKGETWQYYNSSGKVLPIKVTKQIKFPDIYSY